MGDGRADDKVTRYKSQGPSPKPQGPGRNLQLENYRMMISQFKTGGCSGAVRQSWPRAGLAAATVAAQPGPGSSGMDRSGRAERVVLVPEREGVEVGLC